MRDNQVQFAVVREDPRAEIEVVQQRSSRRALLIASGGCTAFALRQRFADLEITAMDPNPAQLELVRAKWARLKQPTLDHAAFNLGSDAAEGLNACGNFESLFRGLRAFLFDLVAAREEFEAVLLGEASGPALLERLRASAYWPVAFELFFSDALLHAMFTEAATQHAPAGSYPAYFREVCERGLARGDAGANPYLCQVFLGHYSGGEGPGSRNRWPLFLREWEGPLRGEIELVQASFPDVPGLSRYDLVSLSNICDWMSSEQVAEVAARLGQALAPGSVVILRQLNNDADLRSVFGDFDFDRAWGQRLLERDQSLFYCRLEVGVRRG